MFLRVKGDAERHMRPLKLSARCLAASRVTAQSGTWLPAQLAGGGPGPAGLELRGRRRVQVPIESGPRALQHNWTRVRVSARAVPDEAGTGLDRPGTGPDLTPPCSSLPYLTLPSLPPRSVARSCTAWSGVVWGGGEWEEEAGGGRLGKWRREVRMRSGKRGESGREGVHHVSETVLDSIGATVSYAQVVLTYVAVVGSMHNVFLSLVSLVRLHCALV